MAQYLDPITKRWLPVQRIDLTLPAYQTAGTDQAVLADLQEQVAELKRRGAYA